MNNLILILPNLYDMAFRLDTPIIFILRIKSQTYYTATIQKTFSCFITLQLQ